MSNNSLHGVIFIYHLHAGHTVNHSGCETYREEEEAEYISSISKAEACVYCGTVLFVAEGGFPFRGHQCGLLSSLSGFQYNCIYLNDVYCRKSKKGTGSCLPFNFISPPTAFRAAVWNILIIYFVYGCFRNPLWHIFWMWHRCSSHCGEYQVPNARDVFTISTKHPHEVIFQTRLFSYVLILGVRSHVDCVFEFGQRRRLWSEVHYIKREVKQSQIPHNLERPRRSTLSSVVMRSLLHIWPERSEVRGSDWCLCGTVEVERPGGM